MDVILGITMAMAWYGLWFILLIPKEDRHDAG
jgi:hypothetical protein